MIKASIDIGSNTVQFLIGQVENSIKELERKQFVTSLGRGLDRNGMFDDQSMKDTLNALEVCLLEIRKFKVPLSSVIVTATEASRVASNAKDFYQKVKKDLGFDVKLLSPYQEALYSTKGLLSSGISESDFCVFDIGGASTEVSWVQRKPFKFNETISFQLGSVRMKSWKKERKRKLEEEMQRLDWKPFKGKKVFGIAGTMTSIAGMVQGLKEYNQSIIEGFNVTQSDLENLSRELSQKTTDEILKKYPFLGKRAEVIPYGVEVAKEILKKLQAPKVSVSTKGLVHGVLL